MTVEKVLFEYGEEGILLCTDSQLGNFVAYGDL